VTSPFPKSFPRRGEIYWVDFGVPQGSEQGGRRPAVVASNDVNNQHSTVVIVAAITSKIPPKPYPFCVHLPASVLPNDGTILCNQLRTLSRDRLSKYQGDLDVAQVTELNLALAVSLGLPRIKVAATKNPAPRRT
jgi:mRNA interferase MazF